MDFAYSPRVEQLRAQLSAFMDRHVVPRLADWQREVDAGAWPPSMIEPLKAQARAEGLWNLFLPGLRERRARDAACQPGVRAARRDHGPHLLGIGDLQLLGARYRQHGALAHVRHARAARGVAGAAAGRPDPLLLRHDRARRRELRCHQHQGPDRAPGRALRDQRPQVVHHQCRRPPLQDLHRHGRDRSGGRSRIGGTPWCWCRWTRPASPSCATCRSCTTSRPKGIARCASRTSACPSPICSARRARASRSPRRGSGPGASITACARSASASWRWS